MSFNSSEISSRPLGKFPHLKVLNIKVNQLNTLQGVLCKTLLFLPLLWRRTAETLRSAS